MPSARISFFVFRPVSLLRQRRIRVLRLPVRRHGSSKAGFLSLFLAPARISSRPGAKTARPCAPVCSSFYGEWFRILLRIRHRQNRQRRSPVAPLHRHGRVLSKTVRSPPGSVGTYKHTPHWFHAATAFATLALELVLVWMLFLPRRIRIICFFNRHTVANRRDLHRNYTFFHTTSFLRSAFFSWTTVSSPVSSAIVESASSATNANRFGSCRSTRSRGARTGSSLGAPT